MEAMAGPLSAAVSTIINGNVARRFALSPASNCGDGTAINHSSENHHRLRGSPCQDSGAKDAFVNCHP